MNVRESIDDAVRGDVEILETGQWYIAVASYDGLESAAQSNISGERAIQKLAKRFEKRQSRKEEEDYEDICLGTTDDPRDPPSRLGDDVFRDSN